jgi:hypothetical protein
MTGTTHAARRLPRMFYASFELQSNVRLAERRAAAAR